MPRDKRKKEKLTEAQRIRRDEIKRNEMMEGDVIYPRSTPDSFIRKGDNIHKLGIFSFQNGVPPVFKNSSIPKGIILSADHSVNTQKKADQANKFVPINENSTHADFLQNLAVALQSY